MSDDSASCAGIDARPGDRPGFSVVVPLYNKRAFVRDSIEAALAQDWNDFEIIVVDDGSTDGSVAALGNLDDPRLRLIEQANAGPGAARNRGIAEARCEWIAFLDADDLWYPDHLAELARIIRSCPNAILVTAAQHHVTVPRLPTREPGSGAVRYVDYFAHAGRYPFGTSATAARRDAFADGGFGNFRPGQDTEMWARLMLKGDAALSTRVTSVYLKQTGGISDRATEARRRAPGATRVDLPSALRTTLERALVDPTVAKRHRSIRRYLDDRGLGGARKALVEGDAARARRVLAQVHERTTWRYFRVRLLVALPVGLVRSAIALRNRVRRASRA